VPGRNSRRNDLAQRKLCLAQGGRPAFPFARPAICRSCGRAS